MVGRRVSPALTKDDAHSYIIAVKETFHDEPTKYQEFIKLLNGVCDHRVDKYSVIARVEELMKDHQDLLLGFSVFLPPVSVEDFINKLKTRFQSLDTHVVGAIRGLMKMFKDGKMSVKEVQEEVIDVLFYHEDLIEDFLRFFTKNPVSTASLLLQL
ncbi:unnamed protein product [Arabidopsis thaliana]|uniref:Paired amphipathic helix (PAH2) superfamily protein n=2 Tax=Arabidopsis TaxID=3701 RepID=A0A654ECI9_ARATH|nr:Paired amphipathic helix [Arabidopsis suecica]VYS47073.1 unnamed protein product [Arabidopsis thaliana]